MKGRKLTNKEVDERLLCKNIKRRENYIRALVKIEVECVICSHVWKVKPNDLFNGHGCPKCYGNAPVTNQEVDNRLNKRSIERIETYKGSMTKISFLCKECNNIWYSRPNDIFTGYGCPSCAGSNGENNVGKLIKIYCNPSCLNHNKRYYIDNKKYFKPDYYWINKNNNQKIFVEYNGHQHYEPRTLGGCSKQSAETNFIKQQNRDRELREYCKQNDIFLLEIPYWWKDDKIIEELQKINR